MQVLGMADARKILMRLHVWGSTPSSTVIQPGGYVIQGRPAQIPQRAATGKLCQDVQVAPQPRKEGVFLPNCICNCQQDGAFGQHVILTFTGHGTKQQKVAVSLKSYLICPCLALRHRVTITAAIRHGGTSTRHSAQ